MEVHVCVAAELALRSEIEVKDTLGQAGALDVECGANRLAGGVDACHNHPPARDPRDRNHRSRLDFLSCDVM